MGCGAGRVAARHVHDDGRTTAAWNPDSMRAADGQRRVGSAASARATTLRTAGAGSGNRACTTAPAEKMSDATEGGAPASTSGATYPIVPSTGEGRRRREIGRAACRERV